MTAAVIVVDGYEIEPDGSITPREIRSASRLSDCYFMMLGFNESTNVSKVRMVYPSSIRFPNGKTIDIDNPYQLAICGKIIQVAAANPMITFQ